MNETAGRMSRPLWRKAGSAEPLNGLPEPTADDAEPPSRLTSRYAAVLVRGELFDFNQEEIGRDAGI